MAELVVIGFDDPYEADRALTELTRLQKEYLIDLEDAVVARRDNDGKVRLKQTHNLTAAGAASGGLWGVLWGTLVGLMLLNPIAGLVVGGAIGAGAGALSGSLVDYGIDDNFMRELAATLQPDHSALFILVRKVQPEKVLQELSGLRGRILRSSLSPEQERRLQEALAAAAQQGETPLSPMNPSPAASGPTAAAARTGTAE